MIQSEYDSLPEMISTTPFQIDDFAAGCLMQQVLDIGCGYGRTLDQLANSGLSPIGLDTSIVQLRRCTPMHFGKLIIAKASSLPFSDESFGGAIALGVIDSLLTTADLKAMVNECGRVLMPGSPFWLNFYTINLEDSFVSRYKSTAETSHLIHTRSGLKVRHWAPEEVEQILSDLFSVVRIDAEPFLSMSHRRYVNGIHIRAVRKG